MKQGQPDPSQLQTTHLGEVVWSGHWGTAGALRRALPCSSSGTWLWMSNFPSPHLWFPAHIGYQLSGTVGCTVGTVCVWGIHGELLGSFSWYCLRTQWQQINTQAHSRVAVYQTLDMNNIVLLWIFLYYSPNPSEVQKFSKLWENLIDEYGPQGKIFILWNNQTPGLQKCSSNCPQHKAEFGQTHISDN